MPDLEGNEFDVVVTGGGQAGLAVGYYLRRSGLRYIILDAQNEPGGAWLHGWRSLRLFSPAQWSSLPGWLMPGGGLDKYPTRDEVLSYLRQYEERYELPIRRPVKALTAERSDGGFVINTDSGKYSSRAIVSATGTWQKPYTPDYPGREQFSGVQIHSAHYESPDAFAGKRVLIIGGGNSGAQILAEVSLVADATWVTLDEPNYLPDDVDGRVLFDAASEKYKALTTGAAGTKKSYDLLGSIVMVEPVREARDAGRLKSRRPFVRFTETGVVWQDGDEPESIDAVIWCTGFKSALDHLAPLGVVEDNGRVKVSGTRSEKEPNLWLVGYGNWTGFASATLIGVGRTARTTAKEIEESLKKTA
ncbi:MAG TPA: ArsO family NAD(P)H-dependent flavin-containing monooxygenase [Pyrinomonadaceae bacterium]|nr:ArsO family NAD(P)H-dependent flavin-containing monooxygenase [Pyrinomonadaceae bacterium]